MSAAHSEPGDRRPGSSDLRPDRERAPAGSALEVARVFLRLGLTSFGGPIAHLAYFHREFVERRRWVDERHFGQLLALCQFLPGPASSQLGFSIGLLRAGAGGAIAAFVAFTTPAALLMFAFAVLSVRLAQYRWFDAVVHGLKLVAVVVVAHGLLGMARTLTPDRARALLAILTGLVILLSPNAWMQLAVVLAAAASGPWVCRSVQAQAGETFSLPYGRRAGTVLLALFAILLLGAVFLAPHATPRGNVAGAFFRAGALVFGGGHVVLPLLKQTVVAPGWISDDVFLSGYGAAQAMPGPMFTVAAFLGERLPGNQGGVAGALTALLAIFTPGLLLVAAAMPFWRAMAQKRTAVRALAAVNASVVGLLAAAFYDPVWITAIRDLVDAAVCLVGLLLLRVARWPVLLIVAFCVGAALLRRNLGC